jgi:hypothetical protein
MVEQLRNFLYGMGLSVNIFAPMEYTDSKGFLEDQKNLRKDFTHMTQDFTKVNKKYGKAHQG